jgi:hypothetical protein
MFLLTNFYGKFLYGASCEKGPEIGRPIDTFQTQQVVKKNMALEVIFLKQ